MLFDKMKAVLHNQRGQGMVEYNLVLILISLMALAALALIGQFAPEAFSRASGSLK